MLAGYAKVGAKIGGQKIQVDLSRAGKTVEVIVEADTRALRHIQRRRAFELVSASSTTPSSWHNSRQEGSRG